MKLRYYTPDGASSGEKDYKIPVFEGDKGVQALRQVVIAFQANQRQGNASTKLRSEVSGSGKKPHRQKGTGSARAGSRRSPIWRGGGVVHGPRPRDFGHKINKKMKSLAFGRALFERASEGDIEVIQQFELPEAKTRHFNNLLQKMLPEGNVLLVDDNFSDDTIMAARNISRILMTDAASLNPYDLCLFDKFLFTESGIETVISRVGGPSSSSSS